MGLILAGSFAAYLTILERNLEFTTSADIKVVEQNFQKQADLLLERAKGPGPTKSLGGTYKLLPFWIFAGIDFVFKPFSPKFRILFGQFLINFFALLFFFWLALAIGLDWEGGAKALLLLGIYLPLLIMPVFTFGQALLIGSYASIAFAVLRQYPFLFIFFVVLASFIRPEIAVCGVFFKWIYERFVLHRRAWTTRLVTLTAFAIPFAVFFVTCTVFGLNDPVDYTGDMAIRFRFNLLSLRTMILLFSPVFVLWSLQKFAWNRICKLMFLSLLPYLGLVFLVGSFTESRLLLPFMHVLILNVASLPSKV